MKTKEKFYRPLISAYRRKKAQHLSSQVRECIQHCQDPIPVILISYNNGVYTENMVNQLAVFNIKPIIIDNNSTDQKTLSTLNKIKQSNLAQIAFSNKNFGHMVGFLEPIYEVLPETFAYSDPDLKLNRNLPKNFIQELARLTEMYHVFKAGLALEIPEDENIIDANYPIKSTKPFKFKRFFSIKEYEGRYWRKQLQHDKLTIFCAPTDTTFAVYKKSNFEGNFYDAVRVAGNFSAIHLPWFPDLDILNQEEKDSYLIGNRSTTWVKN